jgi:polyhydroxyalkanoate synthase subunit PhaE
MSATSWEDLNRRWRELSTQQADATQQWLAGQAQLASTLGGVAASTGGDSENGSTAADDAAALSELWRSWMSLGSLGSLVPNMPGANADGTAQETLGRMFDPVSLSMMGGNQVGEAIRRMTEGPRFADVGETERRMAQVMELYLAVQSAARTYESVIAAAWMEANQLFAARLGERFAAQESALQPKDFLKLWLDIANEVLVKTHRTEGFLEAQRQLLRSGMDFLLAERDLVEELVEPAGLPTRSELDELHQSVQILKRRVRKLERAAEPSKGQG